MNVLLDSSFLLSPCLCVSVVNAFQLLNYLLKFA
jgi:hypothetical protein